MFSFVRDGVRVVRANKSDAYLGSGNEWNNNNGNILVVIVSLESLSESIFDTRQ